MGFTLKGCESIANSLSSDITYVSWGTGTDDLDYTDTELGNAILTKTVHSKDLKGNGELEVQGIIDYTEANGYTISETGLQTSTSQTTLDNHYGLEKNSDEKYIYYYNLYIIPEESLL